MLRRLLFPAIATLAIGGAVTVGVVAFGAGDSAAGCDSAALSEAMRRAIAAAEHQGASQVTIDAPSGCTDADAADVLPQVTRTWHLMPGGIMMREPEHVE